MNSKWKNEKTVVMQAGGLFSTHRSGTLRRAGDHLGNNRVVVSVTNSSVVTIDEESRRNIINTLTKDEAKYVTFKKDGTLDTKTLNKNESDSENFAALKTLANSETKYNFMVSDKDLQGKSFTAEMKEGENFYYGVTSVPNGEDAPSPDNMVYVITSSLLSEGKQAENTAHEGFGHAYFYELSKKDKTIDPWHRYKNQIIKVWNPSEQMNDFEMTFIPTNTRLENQIRIVTSQAIVNFYNKKSKK